MHSSKADSDSDSEDNTKDSEPGPITSCQLSEYKPCAWPHLVTASHFASSSQHATLARDAALWEAFCAELLARQLSAFTVTAQSNGQQTMVPDQAGLQSILALTQSQGQRSPVQDRDFELQEQPQLLCMLWQAAACFAERADSSDAHDRAAWSAITAQSMQVSSAVYLTNLLTCYINLRGKSCMTEDTSIVHGNSYLWCCTESATEKHHIECWL